MTVNKKILFTDLDETLLTTDKRIGDATLKALNDMLDAGHYICFCSGRPAHAIDIITRPYGFNRPGSFIIGCQGAVVMDASDGRVIASEPMDNADAIATAKAIDSKSIYPMCFSENKLLTKYNDEVLIRYNNVTHEEYEIIDNFDQLANHNILKIIAIDYNDHAKLEAFKSYYEPNEAGKLNSFFSCPMYLEYTKLGIDKGTGLRKLADYLHADIADTIACGDEHNDIPMINLAGIGVAVKNAHKDTLDAADYITTVDNNHDAIAEVINKFIL